jgi:hypothetical protein
MTESLRVRVKVNNSEIEIETSDVDRLQEAVNAAAKLLDALSLKQTASHQEDELVKAMVGGKLVEQPQVSVSITEEDQGLNVISELPDIRISKDDTLPTVIVKMFSTEWGRKPRKLMEIKNALDSYGMVHPKQSVAVTLLRLAKSGKLRRFKDSKGEYVYVAGPEITA